MKPMPGPLVVFLITGECDVCLNLRINLIFRNQTLIFLFFLNNIATKSISDTITKFRRFSEIKI